MTEQLRPARSILGLWSRRAGRFALLWLASASVALIIWMQATFGTITFGQIVFHWRFLDGAASISSAIANDCLLVCGLLPLLVAAFLMWFERRLVKPLLSGPGAARSRRLVSRMVRVLPVVVIVASVVTFGVRTSAMQFLSPFGPTDYFSTHYLPPANVKLKPADRKNLVLVYVESLEASYSRTDLFGRDLLASLDELHPVSFGAYEQMPGAGFTIAAMVSTQCGVPLEPVGFLDTHDQGERAKQFLPGAVCLGDLLAAQGYQNVYLGGASLVFSGKGKFLRSHHYQQTFGREQWLKEGVPKTHISGWGLHDDDLFEQAKLKLRQLHGTGQPFNLTVLTVDSHWPSGYLSPGCLQQGAKALDDIFECAARQVADLVRFVRAEGFDADTNIVVLGDHVSPPNTLAAKLDKVPKRLIYNAFFSKVPPVPNRSEIVHFDMMPTILDFIGVHPDGGRIGLGFSGFGPMPTPAPTAETRAEMAEHVLSPSRVYSKLWEPVPKAASAASAAVRPDPA